MTILGDRVSGVYHSRKLTEGVRAQRRAGGCYQSRPSPLLASVLRARSFLALLLFASQELVRDPTYRFRDSAYRIRDSTYRIRYLRSCSRSVLVGPREVQDDARLVPNGPSVVSRRDHHRIVGAKLLLCAVVHYNLHPPRDHVPYVRHLATVGPCDRLDGLRPPPSWLEGGLPHGYIVEGHYVHPAIVERAHFIRGAHILALNAACWCFH